MVLSKQDYLKVIHIFKQAFLENMPIILAFSSRVDGTAEAYSDLDLIVKAESAFSLPVYYQLKDAFEYSTLNFRVDLLDWFRLSDEFKSRIVDKTVDLFLCKDLDKNDRES